MNDVLQRWLMDNKPNESMLYKNIFWKHYTFIRDEIIPLFKNSDLTVEIVGTHWSKSIEHPVIKLIYKNTEIVFRYNFYDYEITVINLDNKPLENLFGFGGIFYSDKDCRFYYQGFPEEYKINTLWEDDKSRFSCIIDDKHRFFAFMHSLHETLNNL